MVNPQNSPLAHYLSLAEDASLETATQICMDATADAQLFVFSEILNAPKIAELQNTSAEKYHRLLRLFAHGTVRDYRQNAGDLPPLSDAQRDKLRLLTLVSLAYGRSRLPYKEIRDNLDLEDDVLVECVLREAVDTGLIRGRMDQRDHSVEILSVVGRDVVAPEGARQMIDLLRSWVSRSSQLVDELDKKIGFISEQTSIASAQKSSAAARAENVRNKLGTERRQGGARGRLIDVDELSGEDGFIKSRRQPSRRGTRANFMA